MAVPTHAVHDDPEKDNQLDERLKITLQERQSGIRTLVIGAHRVIYVAPPPFRLSIPGKGFLTGWQDVREALPAVKWLFRELFTLSPWACATSLTLDLLLALQPTVDAYLTNHMMNLVCLAPPQMASMAGLSIVFGRLKWDTKPIQSTNTSSHSLWGLESLLYLHVSLFIGLSRLSGGCHFD
jgi:hypothetical protein